MPGRTFTSPGDAQLLQSHLAVLGADAGAEADNQFTGDGALGGIGDFGCDPVHLDG
jgi:hypothetical protein